MLVRSYACGRVSVAFAITPECCALSFEGDEKGRTSDGNIVVQPINRAFLFRAGGPAIEVEGAGECRWSPFVADAAMVDCALVDRTGKSTKGLFQAGAAEPNEQWF
ncbi:hypothetical protein CQ035_07835 [Brevundimonas sp. MYb46]|nr:hypothetical protein CQ026_04660 [Brevundimonas sp. MYb31]PRB14352.1 hypothetical protein CQ039_10665 [Brevundimonas sp. MYb52]PRB35403.1 hypothetical protein CQ035_07835 [Brevundimonas sp. MYb46]